MVDQKPQIGYNSYTLAKQEHQMDYLIKMEMARLCIARAIDELAEVEGLEDLIVGLVGIQSILSEETAEYKEHSDLDLL